MCRDVYHTQGNNPKLKLQSLSVLASFHICTSSSGRRNLTEIWQKKSDSLTGEVARGKRAYNASLKT